jgi:hypothetical protein
LYNSKETKNTPRPRLAQPFLLAVDVPKLLVPPQCANANAQESRYSGRRQISVVSKGAANRLRDIIILVAHCGNSPVAAFA